MATTGESVRAARPLSAPQLLTLLQALRVNVDVDDTAAVAAGKDGNPSCSTAQHDGSAVGRASLRRALAQAQAWSQYGLTLYLEESIPGSFDPRTLDPMPASRSGSGPTAWAERFTGSNAFSVQELCTPAGDTPADAFLELRHQLRCVMQSVCLLPAQRVAGGQGGQAAGGSKKKKEKGKKQEKRKGGSGGTTAAAGASSSTTEGGSTSNMPGRGSTAGAGAPLTRVMVQEPHSGMFILLEVHGVRQLLPTGIQEDLRGADLACPCVEVRYLVASAGAVDAAERQLQQALAHRWSEEGGMILGTADTVEELLLLQEVLELNHSRLAQEYCAEVQASGCGAAAGPCAPGLPARASFLLPLQPVAPSKRQPVHGCLICGAPAKDACPQCRLVHYCSGKCQGVHWPSHKAACNGRLQEQRQQEQQQRERRLSVLVDLSRDVHRDQFGTPLSMQAALGSARASSAVASSLEGAVGEGLPLNPHGHSLFAIKVQGTGAWRQAAGTAAAAPRASGAGAGEFLLYDRTRSFSLSLGPDQEGAYRAMAQAMLHSPLGVAKIFLWASRDSDSLLRVYLDDLPSQHVTW